MTDVLPWIGSKWKHKKGTTYEVLMVTNSEGDRPNDDEFPVTVVYKGEDGRVWSRPLSRWYGSFTLMTEFDFTALELRVAAHLASGGEFDPKELSVSTYRSRPSGWFVGMDTGVRVTHLPTGLFEQCDTGRSQHSNKAKALEQLVERFKALAKSNQLASKGVA